MRLRGPRTLTRPAGRCREVRALKGSRGRGRLRVRSILGLVPPRSRRPGSPPATLGQRPAPPGPARLRRRREAQPAGPALRGSRPRLRSRPGPAGGTHLRSPAVPPQSPRPGRRGPGPPRLRRPVHNFCLRRAAPLPPPAPVALPRARPLPRPRVRHRLRHLRNVAPDQARGYGAPGAHAALRIGRPDYGSQRPARRR